MESGEGGESKDLLISTFEAPCQGLGWENIRDDEGTDGRISGSRAN